MEYEITQHGVTYVVEPLIDDGELFAVIRSASGLEAYGAEDLPELFGDQVHARLARELEAMMLAEGGEV